MNSIFYSWGSRNTLERSWFHNFLKRRYRMIGESWLSRRNCRFISGYNVQDPLSISSSNKVIVDIDSSGIAIKCGLVIDYALGKEDSKIFFHKNKIFGG